MASLDPQNQNNAAGSASKRARGHSAMVRPPLSLCCVPPSSPPSPARALAPSLARPPPAPRVVAVELVVSAPCCCALAFVAQEEGSWRRARSANVHSPSDGRPSPARTRSQPACSLPRLHAVLPFCALRAPHPSRSLRRIMRVLGANSERSRAGRARGRGEAARGATHHEAKPGRPMTFHGLLPRVRSHLFRTGARGVQGHGLGVGLARCWERAGGRRAASRIARFEGQPRPGTSCPPLELAGQRRPARGFSRLSGAAPPGATSKRN